MPIKQLLKLAAAVTVAACASTAHAYITLPIFTYTSPGNTTWNQMDVTAPNAGAASAPVTVILLHSGGYSYGDKLDIQYMGPRLGDLGYVAVNMNYTLSQPGITSFPQVMTDVLSVVGWIRTTGKTQYNLPDTIVIAGFSSGATIGSTAAMVADSPGIFGLPPIDHPRGYSVDGLFHAFGRTDLVWNVQTYGQISPIIDYLSIPMTDAASTAFYAAASAITYVNPCSPPTVLYHGALDTQAPPGNSIRLAAALTAAGVGADLHIVPDKGHEFQVTGGLLDSADTIAASIPFMLSHGQPACGRVPPPAFQGACCVPTGCSVTALVECHGMYAGNGTTCDNFQCPNPGACCTDPTTCTITLHQQCTDLWMGDGSVCDPIPCPAQGACCASDGACTLRFAQDCDETFDASQTACTPNPCPQPGACCADAGTCAVSFSADCTGPGNTWLGPGSCTPNPCPLPGACCDSGVGSPCTVVLQSVCNGAWFGPGTTCANNPCAQAVACCTPTNCTITLRFGCGGTELVGFACDPMVCETYAAPGACCAGATCTSNIFANCGGTGQSFVSAAVACNGPSDATTPCCQADYTKDGHVTVQDIFSFLGAWFNGSLLADMAGNGTGRPTVESLFRFLTAWFNGCPSGHALAAPVAPNSPAPRSAGPAESLSR